MLAVPPRRLLLQILEPEQQRLVEEKIRVCSRRRSPDVVDPSLGCSKENQLNSTHLYLNGTCCK